MHVKRVLADDAGDFTNRQRYKKCQERKERESSEISDLKLSLSKEPRHTILETCGKRKEKQSSGTMSKHGRYQPPAAPLFFD